MRYIINLLFLAIIASSGALFFSPDVNAQPGCSIMIRVDTIPDSSTEFPYTVTGAVNKEFTITPDIISYDSFFLLPFGDTATVTQGAVDGWVLRDIVCESDRSVGMMENEVEAPPFIENGVSYSIVDSGVTLTCDELSSARCTFINSRTEAIPTLSEWGAIALVLGFGAVGYFVIRRRKVTA